LSHRDLAGLGFDFFRQTPPFSRLPSPARIGRTQA
jgi:hypothetical protein